ncbi:hypothetical protein [Haladaptatus sp. NG-SE-30]
MGTNTGAARGLVRVDERDGASGHERTVEVTTEESTTVGGREAE